MSANDSLITPEAKAADKKVLRVNAEPTTTMLTMDRDGLDDSLQTTAAAGVDHSNSPNGDRGKNQKSSSWWRRGLDTLRKVASNDEEENSETHGGAVAEESHYQPLEDERKDDSSSGRSREEQDGIMRGRRRSPLNEARGSSNRVVDVLAGGGVAAAAVAPRRSAQDDALQQDCSFFYKAHEDLENGAGGGLMPSSPRGRFRALRAEEHQHAFSYQDAVDVLTPSFLQEYKSRYEQLNLVDPDTDYLTDRNHELMLNESEDCSPQSFVTSETTVKSTIFYENEVGRVLMHLPVDSVRLVTDPDLEVGVLSVEQWRRENKDDNDVFPLGGQNHLENKPLSERPPLRYVLTVPPDLYRRIVSEMSDSLTTPFCGISQCCSDTEKADIRIAIVILIVVLLVLFINTEAYGPHG